MGFDSYTKACLHFNGVNGSKEIQDSGNTGHIITAVNGANTCTYTSKIGVGEARWNGSSAYLRIADHADFDFAGNDFVIEGWYRWTAFNAQGLVWSKLSNNIGYAFSVPNGTSIKFSYDWNNSHTRSVSLNTEQWYHIAFVRNGTEFSIYLDGVKQGASFTAQTNYNSDTLPFSLGYDNGSGGFSSYFNGYVDELRISSGTNRGYTGASFTPSTTAFVSDSNTKLLLHLDGALTDNGNTGHTVTNTNVALYAPKIGSSSILLDGTDDYFSAGSASDWKFLNDGTSWTIEGWIYRVNNNYAYLFNSTTQGSSTDIGVWIGISDSNIVVARILRGVSGQSCLTANGSATVSSGEWHHIAVTFDGTDCVIYVDGARDTTTTKSYACPNSNPNTALQFGKVGASYCANIYADELRVSNSIRYTGATFSPSTTAFTSDANTKLLIHGESLDVAGNKPVTFVGTAQIDTSVKEFGSGSLKLDGDSDYVTVPDSADWAFGSGAFTIDFWINATIPANMSNIVGQYSGGGNCWRLGFNNTGSIRFMDYNSGYVLSFYGATALTTGWHHIALVRIDNGNSASSWRLFLDGVSMTITKDYGAWNATLTDFSSSLYIGMVNEGTAYYVNGYIDELRISNGVARWTSDFTPPAKEYGFSLGRSQAVIIA